MVDVVFLYFVGLGIFILRDMGEVGSKVSMGIFLGYFRLGF